MRKIVFYIEEREKILELNDNISGEDIQQLFNEWLEENLFCDWYEDF